MVDRESRIDWIRIIDTFDDSWQHTFYNKMRKLIGIKKDEGIDFQYSRKISSEKVPYLNISQLDPIRLSSDWRIRIMVHHKIFPLSSDIRRLCDIPKENTHGIKAEILCSKMNNSIEVDTVTILIDDRDKVMAAYRWNSELKKSINLDYNNIGPSLF